MSKRVLFPHNSVHCGHGPIIPPAGLEAAREKLKSRPLKCGNCLQNFSAICALHTHLRGDSYHYDKETMTAFPLDENSCPAVINGEMDDTEITDTYFTESGARVMQMKKKKTKKKPFQKEEVTEKPDKIIDIQVYPQEGDNDMADSELVDPANVDLEYSSPAGVSDMEKSVEACDEEPLLQRAGDDNEPMDTGGEENFVEPETIKTENVLPGVAVTETIPDASTGLSIPDQQNLADFETEGMEAEGMQTQTALLMNKQMIIDLHSMETNEDGSLKIVVGEKDAAIFKTPQGEEILKALKAQGKGLSAKNTQIIYNYSVPVALEEAGSDVLVDSDIAAVAESLVDSALKSEFGSIDVAKGQKKKRIYRRGGDDEEEEVEMATGIDGLEAVVFMRKEEKLTTADAMSILQECKLGMHDDKISKIQPLSAKGGDLYVVDLEALPNRKDIRHDKYYWYNCGQKRYPKNDAIIKKGVFKIRLPNQTYSDGFLKSIFEYIDETERYCIIHYTGFESMFKPFPHGNSKTGKTFVRTCPSVIEELKEMANRDLTPTEVHKQVKAVAPAALRGLRTPRNLDQIKNHFFYQKKKQLAMKQAIKKSEATVM